MNRIGQIVRYTLSQADVDSIDNQAPLMDHYGRETRNAVYAGNVYPGLVVRVFDPVTPEVNLQVFLDGAPILWVTSRREGAGPGYWSSNE